MEQINKAVSEMDRVVQKNAASAEESASASEEMNAQAEQMKEFVGELVAVVGGNENGNGDGAISAGGLSHRDQLGIMLCLAILWQGGMRLSRSLSRWEKKIRAKDATSSEAKEVRPEQVIPMEEGDFKEF